jgi:hypothetical protein
MFLATVAMFGLLLVHCTATEFVPSDENNEVLRNIIHTDQHIVIGSSHALYRINPNTLIVDERAPLTAPNRLLVSDVGGSYDGSVLSCDNDRCLLAEVVNLVNISWVVEDSISTVIRTGVTNIVGVFVPSQNGTSEIVYGETANGQAARRFSRGGLVNVNFITTGTPQNSLFSRSAQRLEDDVTESFYYHAQFAHNGFVYFVSSPVEDQAFPNVARVCQNDTGSTVTGRFISHFEIKLECRGESSDPGVITAATLVTTPPFAEPTLLISMLYTGMEEATVDICAFSLMEIDRMMENKFRVCINGTGEAGFDRDRLSAATRQCTAIPPERLNDAVSCNTTFGMNHACLVVLILEP